jgi:hypothetical protein
MKKSIVPKPTTFDRKIPGSVLTNCGNVAHRKGLCFWIFAESLVRTASDLLDRVQFLSLNELTQTPVAI